MREKTPSLDEMIASDSGRAKQNIQAAKEKESNKGKVLRQVQGAKSDLSMTGSDPYKKSSTSVADSIPTKNPRDEDIVSKIPTEAPKPRTSGLSKGELSAESNTPYKSTGSKAAPKPAQSEGSKARAQIERMKDIYSSDLSMKSENYKKGGAVKSGASRGDGCAERGRTRGTMR